MSSPAEQQYKAEPPSRSVMMENALAAVGSALYHTWHFLEACTVILFVEGVMRLWYHLDLRVYSEKRRIKQISEGRLAQKSNRYVVFVLFSKAPLPRFTTNILDAIERSPLNLVIVSNTTLGSALRNMLLKKCHLLVERENLGRDFGAYKDGISIIRQRTKDIGRLILLNDSVFFFERNLDKLVSDLDGTAEYIGLTEVYEIHYHVQSFMLSFGPEVIGSALFLDYWRKYRPVSTRRWAIHKGEVGLTRHLTRAGYRPHILFQAQQLLPFFESNPSREVLEAVRYLPTHLRRRLYRQFAGIVGGDVSIADFEAISQALHQASPYAASNQETPRLKIFTLLDTLNRWRFESFSPELITMIGRRNQVHAGGFLFMKYLGLPVIKRDIFYREVYTLEDVYRILSEFNEPLREEVMSDLRRGGTAKFLKGFRRLLYRHGSI